MGLRKVLIRPEVLTSILMKGHEFNCITTDGIEPGSQFVSIGMDNGKLSLIVSHPKYEDKPLPEARESGVFIPEIKIEMKRR